MFHEDEGSLDIYFEGGKPTVERLWRLFAATMLGIDDLRTMAKPEIFERSKTEQRRELIAFVFSNLRLRGKKLEFSLRSPFDLMVNRAIYTSWLGD